MSDYEETELITEESEQEAEKRLSARKRKRREKARRRRQRRRRIAAVIKTLFFGSLALIIVIGLAALWAEVSTNGRLTNVQQSQKWLDFVESVRPELDIELLDYNYYSRPGTELDAVNGVVIHYTANPGASAIANRNYFENLMTTHETSASSHFVVGLEGEIVQCIPCNEVAYASNDRNNDTISIECCIEDESGEFNQATYDSAVELTAWLLARYDLSTDDVIRHYDVTGKMCPLYYVDHPEKWESFKEDVGARLEELRRLYRKQ